jgi:general secretion pathway protein F
MPRYLCRLVDASGRELVEAREALSRADVAAAFSGGELFLVSAEESTGSAPAPRRRLRPADLAEFTAMLSALVESGLELKDALAIERSIAKAGSAQESLAASLVRSVEKGTSLSGSLAAFDPSLPPFYLGMVRIGERVGSLGKVLPRLASYLAERKALRDKTANALAYPALVLSAAILGAVGILAFVVPRLIGVFEGLGGAAAEQARRSAAAMAAAAWAFAGACALALAGAFLLARLRRASAAAALRLDSLALRLPALGPFLLAYESLDFAYAMEALVGSGVSIEAALGESAAALRNAAYRGAVERCREAVRRGESLSLAAGRRGELPPLLGRWIAVGERSGQVERVFEQLRRYYQGEVDRMSSRFAALLEPALILFVGAILAAFVLAFVVPLFSIYGAIL